LLQSGVECRRVGAELENVCEVRFVHGICMFGSGRWLTSPVCEMSMERRRIFRDKWGGFGTKMTLFSFRSMFLDVFHDST